MYKGEVNVGRSSLPTFLKTAESLQVSLRESYLNPPFTDPPILCILGPRTDGQEQPVLPPGGRGRQGPRVGVAQSIVGIRHGGQGAVW